METASELFNKVRHIEIKTRRLSDQMFAGQYHSAFKGKGMAFSEVREYQYGDDIRNIDWNVTARYNHPYVKVFEEERELTMILLIDMSSSNQFGSLYSSKHDMITEMAGILAFSALNNNDKVGAIFFTDKVEKFIPPKKGQSHILRIIRELITFKPQNQGTDIKEALEQFNRLVRKKTIAFLISDFQANGYEKALSITARKHDLVLMQISDPLELEIPPLGLSYIQDVESGQIFLTDTANENFRKMHKQWFLNQENTLKQIALKHKIDLMKIICGKDYIPALIQLFKQRERRL